MHQLELDQSQPLDKLASFDFKEIELDYECEPDPQLCDLVLNFESMLTLISLPNLDPNTELTLIPIPINHEIESLIVDSHILLMDHEYELKFFDLEPTIEPKLTLESKLDFLKLVLIPEPIILEPKSITSSIRILLLNQGVDYYDSEIIFQDWSYNRDSFIVRVLHDPIHLRDCKNVNKKEVIKGGFLYNPQDLDWVATLGPI